VQRIELLLVDAAVRVGKEGLVPFQDAAGIAPGMLIDKLPDALDAAVLLDEGTQPDALQVSGEIVVGELGLGQAF
jgi:hypothetical protein